jgi:hypothetical protein
LLEAIKGMKNTKSYKVKKLIEYESFVMPKKSEVWALRQKPQIQTLLENKEVREMMKAIKSKPEKLKFYLKVYLSLFLYTLYSLSIVFFCSSLIVQVGN